MGQFTRHIRYPFCEWHHVILASLNKGEPNGNDEIDNKLGSGYTITMSNHKSNIYQDVTNVNGKQINL